MGSSPDLSLTAQLQCKLIDSLIGAGQGIADRTVPACVHDGVRLTERRRVRDVVRLSAKLELCLLEDWKLPEKRKVNPLLVRPGENVFPGITRCAKGLCHECRGVEPLIDARIGYLSTTATIGAIRTHHRALVDLGAGVRNGEESP